MTEVYAPNEPPRAHVRIVFLGPVSPHWDVVGDYVGILQWLVIVVIVAVVIRFAVQRIQSKRT